MGKWEQFSTSNNIYLLFKMFYKLCDWWSFLRKERTWIHTHTHTHTYTVLTDPASFFFSMGKGDFYYSRL